MLIQMLVIIICRILDDLLYSGGSYLIVYQSYVSQVHRKTPAVLLCKSIVISIQWFHILHIITFSTIYNSTVLFSGARVSQNLSLVPQLRSITALQAICHNYFVYFYVDVVALVTV